ncbi:HD domain-containing protein [Leeia sp. TBRC 13508]|uniref:HD domain-containing protein n=1 Tax=Leeia speluncae TaxID=2884804 RepID=A0ABS8DBV4_9NEIS|nr:HD domain-containing protein [Leeia speluncae]MCB6185118.1 HD domain-containing protein [Leeia speluncae]
MEHVSFKQMKDGTAEEFIFLRKLENEFCTRTASRLIEELIRQKTETLEGYRITRYEHAVQSATRAMRDGADDDWIVATLLHDIADGIAPRNHDRAAAEILRPFVREDVCWVIEHHALFQTFYYGEHLGWDKYAREAYKDHPWYQLTVDFCENWDQSSFDENYPSEPLETFIPIVERVFNREPYWFQNKN